MKAVAQPIARLPALSRARRARGAVVVAAAPQQQTGSALVKPLAGVAVPLLAVAGSSALFQAGLVPNEESLQAYFHATAGFVFDADTAGNVPFVLKQWFHGANMALALGAMGGYGTYLGWSIRAGKGDEASLTGTPVRDLHPQLMGVMTGIFLAGGSGGALFSLLLGRPPLESPHAITAFAGLGLLAANGLLSTVMKDSPDLRTAHAFLGTGLMAVFAAHAALGVDLALKIGDAAAAV